MPLFGHKFSPRKTPVRKSSTNINSDKLLDDLVGENRSIKINLGDHQFVFEDGEWIPSSRRNSSTNKLNQKLKRRNQELQEENNFLKVKYELILNMLAEITAQKQIQDREMDKLRRNSKR